MVNNGSTGGAVAANSRPPGRDDEEDVERLFEVKTVDEIAEFSHSLTRDIDRKREELRTMVGERYRDLMEAADTIARMRTGAEAVIANIDGVMTKGQVTVDAKNVAATCEREREREREP